MYPQHCCAILHRDQGQRHTRVQPLRHRQPEERTNHGLARQPGQNRRAQCTQLAEAAQEFEVVFDGLAETETGVDDQALTRNAGRDTGLDPLMQEIAHLAGHIGVDRMVLHAARLALHVHETHRNLQRGRGFDRTRLAQRAHVVDEAGTGRDRGTHHFRLGGVDGDRHRHGAGNRFDDRDHPVELFLHTNRLRTRTGGFAADIDDVRALLDHRECVGHGRVARQKNTPVREGVGGDVQDPHDGGAREIERATTTVERRQL